MANYRTLGGRDSKLGPSSFQLLSTLSVPRPTFFLAAVAPLDWGRFDRSSYSQSLRIFQELLASVNIIVGVHNIHNLRDLGSYLW